MNKKLFAELAKSMAQMNEIARGQRAPSREFQVDAFSIKALRMTLINRITSDSQVMGGKPCIRDTRVTVETIVGLFTAGRSQEEILQAYPYLEPEDLQAALAHQTDYSRERDRVLGSSTVNELVDEIERRRKNPPAK